MYVAVISEDQVLEVASNESCLQDGMIFYKGLGYKNLTRVNTTVDFFDRHLNGEKLSVNIKHDGNGENLRLTVAA